MPSACHICICHMCMSFICHTHLCIYIYITMYHIFARREDKKSLETQPRTQTQSSLPGTPICQPQGRSPERRQAAPGRVGRRLRCHGLRSRGDHHCGGGVGCRSPPPNPQRQQQPRPGESQRPAAVAGAGVSVGSTTHACAADSVASPRQAQGGGGSGLLSASPWSPLPTQGQAGDRQTPGGGLELERGSGT